MRPSLIKLRGRCLHSLGRPGSPPLIGPFYGITENTVAAATGFEMAHNKILGWACSYKCGSSAFSYRIGVADWACRHGEPREGGERLRRRR
jgi:hypothetical protein